MRNFFVACVVLVFLSSPGLTQEDASVPENQKSDQPLLVAPQIAIHIMEVLTDPTENVELKSGDTMALHKQIAEFVTLKKAKVVERFSLVALNETSVEAQAGASRPNATGSSSKGGRTFAIQEIGTIVSCTPRAVGEHVIVDILYDKSELVGGDEEVGIPAAKVRTRWQGIVRISNRRSIVIRGGQRPGPDGKPVEWNVVIDATLTK